MRSGSASLAVLPREPHPYQESLYRELRLLDADVRYLGAATPSHSLNVALMPFQLLWLRARGTRVLHIHWVFGFVLPATRRLPFLRRVTEQWFLLVLWLARRSGMCVVWTAHNVLPHERVFHDDVRARRRLIESSDLVIAHSPEALNELPRQIGVTPKRTVLVALGPSAPFAEVDAATLRPPGSGEGPRRFLFIGRVSAYKGTEELLRAASAVADRADIEVTVAGKCSDPELRTRLEGLAEPLGKRATLRLEQVSDAEFTALMDAADVVVLPYRKLTTSSSVMDAMVHGRAVIVPDFPAFSALPADTLIRYDGSEAGLAAALEEAATCDPERLRALGDAAARHVASYTWAAAAQQTLDAIRSACASR